MFFKHLFIAIKHFSLEFTHSIILISPIQAAAVLMGGWFMTHPTSTQILNAPKPAFKSERKLLLIYLD